MTASDDKPLWRFTRFLDSVLIVRDGLWEPVNPGRQTFVVLGRSRHPSGVDCLAGELVGGPNCGMRFLFAPEDEENWEHVAVRA